MDFVHVGRDEEPAEEAVGLADRNVGVMKLGGEKDEQAVYDEVPGFEAEQGDEQQAEQGRENEFAPVEAGGGGDIHVGIAVMHAVESPEERNAMIHPVPAVGPGVEQNNGEDGLSNSTQRQMIEEPPVIVVRPLGGEFDRDTEEQSQQQGIQNREDDVMQGVLVACFTGDGFECEPAFPAPEQGEEQDR